MLALTERKPLFRVFGRTLALIACWLFGKDVTCGISRSHFYDIFFREPHVWVNFLLHYRVKVVLSKDMRDLLLEETSLQRKS